MNRIQKETKMEQEDPYVGQVLIQVIRTLEENLMEAWMALEVHPRVEIYAGEDLTQFVSGVPFPLCNGIFQARLNPEGIDDAIEEALQIFRERKLPGLWWVGPSSSPEDLESRLQRHGLAAAGNVVGMAADLSMVADSLSFPEGISLAEVTDETLLGQFFHPFSTVFSIPPFAADFFREAYRGLGFEPQTPLRNYVAFHEGRPVASASLFLEAGAAGIYNVAVLPEFRRKGIGKAMTLRAIEDAKTSGYGIGVLHAMEGADALYRSIGFQEYCRFASYLWQGPEPPSRPS